MQWKVKYQSKCDLNDGDYSMKTGNVDNPSDPVGYGKGWIVDDTNKHDMKMLALVQKAMYYKFLMGIYHDLDEVDDESLIRKLKLDPVLKKMHISDDEIESFVYEQFSVDNYLPGSADYEAHNYDITISLIPVEYDIGITDEFLLKLWADDSDDWMATENQA